MSLDKQKILSELGSVMNQLQSADCGCMGKLFSNPNQGGQDQMMGSMGSPLPTCGGCRRGCCRGHGYNFGAPCAGEPYSMNQPGNMNRPCMGHCNPPKLYADTYNYLNNNLMQPVVQDVYNELKTMNPGNTIANNPLANQMGLGQGNAANAGNNMAMAQGNMPNANMGNQMQNMPGMESSNSMNSMPTDQSQQPMNNNMGMGAMGGMGPNIVNMMMGDASGKPSNPNKMQGQGGPLTGPMVIDAPQSPHGQVGLTPINPNQNNQVQYGAYMNQPQQHTANMMPGQTNPTSYSQNPTTQYMSQPNYFPGGNSQRNPMMGNAQNIMPPGTGNQNFSPATPQAATPTNHRAYGQHTQGMTKFNEMFPGVMQGDLGFDPMAIAIQMNPANQQKAAMDTMQKLMNGTPMSRIPSIPANAASINPAVDGTQSNMSQSQNITNQGQQNLIPSENISPQPQVAQNAGVAPAQQSMVPQQQQQSMIPQQQQQQSMVPHQQQQQSMVPQQQQQVYTAVTGAPQTPHQQMQAYQQPNSPQHQYQQQQMVDPNTGAPISGNEGVTDHNNMQQQPLSTPQNEVPLHQQMIKEPIFPADNSRISTGFYTKQRRRYEYNTLGQPVETFPASMFHPPEQGLPQTLSPQPASKNMRNDYMRYSNVKSTVSKTSIMGNKPEGRTPSKSQLQHIYNQYKGSHSYTQQNVKAPPQGATLSDGKLNVPPVNTPQIQVPIERVGGDNAAVNQIANNQLNAKVEEVIGRAGDMPAANKPQGDGAHIQPSVIPERQSKLRNGLQDVVYTSYPSSAAWTFHGTDHYRSTPVGYGFRN